jgi:hypothetical protein
MVLPRAPREPGTSSEDEPAARSGRDAMVGVATVSAP